MAGLCVDGGGVLIFAWQFYVSTGTGALRVSSGASRHLLNQQRMLRQGSFRQYFASTMQARSRGTSRHLLRRSAGFKWRVAPLAQSREDDKTESLTSFTWLPAKVIARAGRGGRGREGGAVDVVASQLRPIYARHLGSGFAAAKWRAVHWYVLLCMFKISD